MADDIWVRYNDAQRARTSVRELTARVIELAGDGAGRLAFDLGCGSGIETRALAEAGWRVIAADSAPGTLGRVADALAVAAPDARTRVEIREQDFLAALADAAPVDLVHASASLPFARDAFDEVWVAVVRGIRPSGWLAVDLFGERDGFGGRADVHLVRDAELADLLAPIDVVEHEVLEWDGPYFGGEKHWHVHRIVARRR